MAGFLRWWWFLLVGNPLLVRVVEGGSRRVSHLWARMGYLGVLMVLMVTGLLVGKAVGRHNLSDLAKAGTLVFAVVAYGQVVLISLLAPLFLAGAIAQEQSGQTYDILLTTPLSSLHIVLGSLLGRLFFIWALLASGFPLFAVLMIFGGVALSSIWVAFVVAALVALGMGAVAVTLSVLWRSSRKAIYAFVVATAVYLVGSYALDQGLRQAVGLPLGPAVAGQTTWLTPLHPLLVLESYLNSANYHPPAPEDLAGWPWVVRMYRAEPLSAFTAITLGGSLILVFGSAWRLRRPLDEAGFIMRWLGRLLGMSSGISGDGADTRRRRPARTVWHNPIAWQEAHTRAQRPMARIGRIVWALLMLGAAGWVLGQYHRQARNPLTGRPFSADDLYAWVSVLLWVELALVAMVAVYLSAGSVSREREDGTLDVLLTTPITPRQYLWGKLRGLVRLAGWLLATPLLTMAMLSIYTVVGLWRQWPQARPVLTAPSGTSMVQGNFPLVLPEAVLLWPLTLLPFAALCVALGLGWSIKSRGVLGAVVRTVAVLAVLTVFFGMCGPTSARHIPLIGVALNGASPATNFQMLLSPWQYVSGFADDEIMGRVVMVISQAVVGGLYVLIVYSMLQTMVRQFDQNVRRLSGTTN